VQTKENEPEQANEKVNNGRVEVIQSSCNDTNSQSTIVLHAILPVKVRQKNSGKIITTCAFYDNGSSGCFITERLKNQMNAVGIETSLQLGTMHGLSFINSHVLNELVVTYLNDNNDIELPRTYTREQIINKYQPQKLSVVLKTSTPSANKFLRGYLS
jgi:hypothetical protein